MPKPEFFRTAGLYLKDKFLSPEQCAAVRQEMAESQQSDAALARGVSEMVVDPYVRKTKLAKVSQATSLKIRDALVSLLPELSAQFKETLTEVQQTDYLVYREGGFIAPHLDVSKSKERMEAGRKVSIVVFLNDQTETPSDDSFAGGSLVFYGLLPAPFNILGHPLVAQRGSLVAFRPSVLHEVKPVTRGIRYTLANWCV
jgi:SM-20-related protein